MSKEKQQKRVQLIESGLNPYPYQFQKTLCTTDVSKGLMKKNCVGSLAGRLMRIRTMGKASFFNLQDQEGQCQCYVKVNELAKRDQEFFKYSDIGDIVGVKGTFFQTKKGENTLRIESFCILCKSTQVLPEKYHGLEDKELRYRYRHLDFVMNTNARKILLTRSRVIQLIRKHLTDRGFVEAETPVLQPIYGGAMASPFSTKHNSLDSTFYLKISPELYLKRLVAGGFEKVFEIGKNFRNEGMDRLHNPEFTMLEYYEAYTDYQDQMTHFENLVSQIVQLICEKKIITYQGKKIDFSTPWKRLSIQEGIQEQGGFDAFQMNQKQLFQKLQSLKIECHPDWNWAKLVMIAFEYFVEKTLWQPTFVIDFPKDVSPLTKNHRQKEGLVERFEPFIAGMEIGNAYSELNDPVDQRERLNNQQRSADAESHPMDEDFLHAVEVGIPPLGGVGLGIDRLIMLLTDQSSIREVIWFPTVKIKNK